MAFSEYILCSWLLKTILSTEVFGCIRSLAPFRFVGASRDFIVVGSDSGRIVVLEYSAEHNMFEKVHQETYGKSGCRRITPGQYLAVDPKGRATMIGACEKQKLVYILNRDNAANLTISSPLEAHKSHTIVFSIVGTDVGFDNPVFAAIELDYSEVDQVGISWHRIVTYTWRVRVRQGHSHPSGPCTHPRLPTTWHALVPAPAAPHRPPRCCSPCLPASLQARPRPS